MRSDFARLLSIIGAVVIIGSITIYLVVDFPAAKSFAYGSTIAMIGTMLLAWRHWQAERCADVCAESVLRQAYRAAIERYIWAAVMLALGFKILELMPLWLVAGFVMGQAVSLFAPIWMRLRTQNDD